MNAIPSIRPPTKTAWRPSGNFKNSDGVNTCTGPTVDEAYVGGRRSGGKRGRGAPGKAIVMGMKERGRVAARVIPDVRKETLREVVLRNVEPGSAVSTDELMSYGLLAGDGFIHGRVKHAAKEWTY